MKNRFPLFLIGFAALSLALLTHCNSDKGSMAKKNEYAPVEIPANELCITQPSWFPHSQTPAPAEGPGSPFDTSSTSNQIFHQWSWNKFLWLTKPDKGNNPLFLNTDLIKQVTPHMELIQVPQGTTVVLQEINQAGTNNPILKTNPNYNSGTSETVYYSIHMNNLMYKSGLSFAAMIANKQVPASNDSTFPVGSFELKAAWVPVSAIPTGKQSDYYITTASLSSDAGKTFSNVSVALIGMHVVGVVQNHPEFIWATFEHDDLAPNYDWSANSASSTADKMLFAAGNVTGIDGIRYDSATKLGITPYRVFDLFQYGVPRDSTGGFMTTSQEEPVNFNNVQGINECVKGQLTDVWQHYFYNGSIWLNMDGKTPLQQAQLITSLGYSIANVTTGSSARGSMNCANVTMESFMQTFESNIQSIKAGNLANCFSCHTGVSFSGTNTSPLYLSHSFQGFMLRQQGKSSTQVESLKTQDEKRTRLRMSK